MPNPHDCCFYRPMDLDTVDRGHNPPKLIIVGVQKGATSYLAAVMRETDTFRNPKCPYGDLIDRWVGSQGFQLRPGGMMGRGGGVVG